jgi:hypothetical protein
MLKNAFWRRLLKKIQMQGGVTHPWRMGTRRGASLIPLVVSLSNHVALREHGAPTAGGSPQMGLFQQPAKRAVVLDTQHQSDALPCFLKS